MFRYLLIYMACLLFAFSVKAQGISNDTIPKEVLMLDGKPMTEKQIQRYHKQLHKDSIRANKRIWWSILGGPSYTPEASFGVGGAVLASFRLNKNDTISQRSFIPAGFNITLNGTFVFAGAGTLFFNENRFRIYISYGYRNEPSHYFGKGYETIEQIEKSDSTTKFHKSSIQLYPRFVWEVRPHLYTGPLFDINFSKSDDINPVMAEDPYFNKFKRDYVNIGVGGLIQYDTRNDVATPSSGMLLSAIAKVYGKYLGGAYNYEMFELEYRQFQQVFRPRSTLAWIAKTQIGVGNVPFTELPSFGSPFDLRGYYWGKYRDKTMAYGILEYRHMFGSVEKYTEAMKNNLAHFSELMEQADGMRESIDTLMKKNDDLHVRLTADMDREVSSPEVQRALQEIIELSQDSLMGMAVGDGYWNMVIESYENEINKAITDQKYGEGASDYIADALRYYFHK